MPFKKGKSGNSKGRPKGAMNICSKDMRNNISIFLSQKYEHFINDYDQLLPNERVKVFISLIPFIVSKLEPMRLESEFDRYSNNQLDAIIERISKNK